jgi:hypothetical protein
LVPSVLRGAPYYIPTWKHYDNFIFGLIKVAPNIAKNIYDNLPFSHLGYLTKPEGYYLNATKKSFKS